MVRKTNQTAALLLGTLICVSSLASCAKSYKSGMMYIENSGNLQAKDLYLLAAVQKQTYEDVVKLYADGDWNAVAVEDTGKTFSDIVGTVTVESAKTSLVCEYLHDKEYGLKLSDDQKTQIERTMDSHIAAYGSKNALNEALSVYSADADTLKRYYTLSAKQLGLYTYLFGENGTVDLEDEAKARFESDYAIVTHIYFNLGYKLKDDGSKVSLTEEEIAEKRERAENVYGAILSGEDFFDLRLQYSEDNFEADYFPHGFFVSADTDFPAPFRSAALDMKVGEVRKVECNDATDNGIHIMLKLPMEASLYNTNDTVYQSLISSAISAYIDDMMVEYESLVTTDEAAMADFDISLIPALDLLGGADV